MGGAGRKKLFAFRLKGNFNGSRLELANNFNTLPGVSVTCRGRTPDWYNSVYGHLVANYARRIRQSFSQDITASDVPETNV